MQQVNEKYLSWSPDDWSIQQDPSLLPEGFDAQAVINVDASGILYKAVRTSDRRKVTLKVLTPELTIEKEQQDISHENIAEVEEVITPSNGSSIVVLEHLRGTSIEGIISKHRRLKTFQALTIIQKLLSAVSAVHQKGRVLNSINPKSVFLSRNTEGELDIDMVYLVLDGADTILNDPEYLSPEQLSCDMQPDPAGDLWAVSVILFELAFGGHPFKGKSKEETLGRILEEEVWIPSLLARSKPALSAVVRRALSKETTYRYLNAVEMMVDIDAILSGKQSVPAPRSVPAVPLPSSSLSAISPERDEFDSERDTLEVIEPRPSQIRAMEAKALAQDRDSSSLDDSRLLILNTPTIPAPVSSERPEEAYPSHPDLTDPSVMPAQLAMAERSHQQRSWNPRSLIAAGIGALVAALIFAVIWMYTGHTSETHPADRGPHSESIAPKAAAVIAPTRGGASDPKTEQHVDIAKENTSADAEASKRKMVTITVENLEADTLIKIGERWVENPITLRRSDKPVELTFIPRKKRSFTHELVPSENHTVDTHIIAKPISSKSRRKKPGKTGSKSSNSSDAQPGNLSSNPFKLKSNPFPTGE